MKKRLFLGIDASTQSMSAVVIDCENPKNVFSLSVNFDENFPEYKTSSGVCTDKENPTQVWSYPLMWVDALELLMHKLSENIDVSCIAGIGGAGQQHASVWLNSVDVFKNLKNVQKGKLSSILKQSLSSERAPVWLDTSTSQECEEIASIVGDNNVLQKSGSVQTERFTGAQIRKIFKKNRDVYERTRRIHLNSSFICSILSHNDAPLDYGDASGMNLMSMPDFTWDCQLLEATAPNLKIKLPLISKSMRLVGPIGEYFVKNYGFNSEAKVFVFSGDNPSSLVGCGASSGGSAVVSLGTSDTFFCANNAYFPIDCAHIFGNPAGSFMNLTCFRNGSLAREALKRELGISWQTFDSSFDGYIPTQTDKIILPYYFDEISPKIKSDKIRCIGFERTNLEVLEIVRLFIEGQFFNMRLQADELKAKVENILLTGGASKSSAMAQCVANVFNSNVYTSVRSENSSALGGALTAAVMSGEGSLKSLSEIFNERKLVASPQSEAVSFYKNKIITFARARENLIKGNCI